MKPIHCLLQLLLRHKPRSRPPRPPKITGPQNPPPAPVVPPDDSPPGYKVRWHH